MPRPDDRREPPRRGKKPPTRTGGSAKRRPATDGRPAKRTRTDQRGSSDDRSTRRPSPKPRSASHTPGRASDRGRPEPPPEQGPTTWGGVARRGAGRLKAEDDATAAAIWRKTVVSARERERLREQNRDPAGPPTSTRPGFDEEVVEVREVATDAVGRATRRTPATGRRRSSRQSRPAPPRRAGPPVNHAEVRDQLTRDVGPSQAPKLAERLADAGRAFSRERYDDARRMLRPLAQKAPRSAGVRELNGLTLYRLGKWRDAIKELEQFRLLTNSTEQHPVLADSYRALGRYTEVDELWRELREASPTAALVAEGRIVMAGSLADQDRLADAVRLMEQGVKFPRRVQDHHLRMWYALADLYERAGDMVKSRQLFERIVDVSPDFADAATRLRSLR